ncbi:MAG: glycosyltransferase [Bacteroidetes bacterium]|nr:glycosyltransferase [Bacteroidota bacterium]MBU2506229.1 glycosyltransferase [Bacteroidota bacterium]
MQLYQNFNPSVSIILPTFNRERLITRAINSVLGQSYTNWELIIVDDGSEDDTFAVVNPFLYEHRNIRYMKHANRYLPISLNIGIQASIGKYVTFLGSDDEYKKDHLEDRISFIKNSNFDLIHGGVEIIGDEYVKDKNNIERKIHLSECILGGTFLGKREVFLELDGFKNIKYSEDSEFFERANNKFKIGRVNYPTYIYYRDTPDSICNTI